MKAKFIYSLIIFALSELSAYSQPLVKVHTKKNGESLSWQRNTKTTFATTDSLPSYVDLGLSVKWANFNLGAKSIYEEGYLFTFGDILPLPTDGSVKRNIPLSESNYNKVAGTDKDPVYCTLGYPWRMPVVEEYEELLNAINDKNLKLVKLEQNSTPLRECVVYGSSYIPFNNISEYEYLTHRNKVDKYLMFSDYWFDDRYFTYTQFGQDTMLYYKPKHIRPVYAPTPVEKIAIKGSEAIVDDSIHFSFTYNKVNALQGTGVEVKVSGQELQRLECDNSISFDYGKILDTKISYRPYVIVGGQYVYDQERSLTTPKYPTPYTALMTYSGLKQYQSVWDDVKEGYVDYVFPSAEAWNAFAKKHSEYFAVTDNYSYYRMYLSEKGNVTSVCYSETVGENVQLLAFARKWKDYLLSKQEKSMSVINKMIAESTSYKVADGSSYMRIANAVPEDFFEWLVSEPVFVKADSYTLGSRTGFDGVNQTNGNTVYSFNGTSAATNPSVYFEVPDYLLSCKYDIQVVIAPDLKDSLNNVFKAEIFYNNGTKATDYFENSNADKSPLNYYTHFESFSDMTECETITLAKDYSFPYIQPNVWMGIRSGVTNADYKQKVYTRNMNVVGFIFTPKRK